MISKENAAHRKLQKDSKYKSQKGTIIWRGSTPYVKSVHGLIGSDLERQKRNNKT